MNHGTPIEWTHVPGYRGETWNPVSGCSVASPGCRNCYAMNIAGTRLKNHPLYHGVTDMKRAGPVFNGVMKAAPQDHKVWRLPLTWRSRRAIFVADMCDLFHPSRRLDVIAKVFARMALTPRHIYFVLTKHPQHMHDVLTGAGFADQLLDQMNDLLNEAWIWKRSQKNHRERIYDFGHDNVTLPLPNVWLGVSAENQEWADQRIPVLMRIPAAVRFVSCEPLLGAVDLRRWLPCSAHVRGWACDECDERVDQSCKICGFGHTQLDWAIAGGESGPRPSHDTWVKTLRDTCMEREIPFFFKQWGNWSPYCYTVPPIEERIVYLDGRSGPCTDDYIASQHAKGLHTHGGGTIMRRDHKKKIPATIDGHAWREWPKVERSA